MRSGESAIRETLHAVPARRRTRERLVSLMRRQPVMVASALFIFIMGLLAILAPVLGLSDPAALNIPEARLPPSLSHPFGTTSRGVDQLVGVMFGARVSLMVSFFGVLLGVGAGAVWGLLSGYAGGKADAFSQRLVEIILSTPGILLAFVLAAALRPGLMVVILAISVTNLGQSTRLIRGVTLSAKQGEYVMAARAVGAQWPRIVSFHVAPGIIAPFLVLFSAQIGFGIITEATLGFLGIGVPPTVPSWGGLLTGALDMEITPPWWSVVVPGAAIALVVLAFNLFGDGLRDEMDPRLRGTS